MQKILMLLILVLCFNNKGFSETIEVTSNADNGPGTFREALTRTAANGTVTRDYIHFNLPGTTDADRSIQTDTPLPALTSNLVIDGTTQSGMPFGVTQARVKILCNNDFYLNQAPVLSGAGVDGLEIYGLWIDNLNDYGAVNGSLVLENSGKITIGAAGKGNYFKRNYITMDKIAEFVFQANICFSNEFGDVGGNNVIRLTGAQKVLIGGSEATGNLIAGSIDIDGSSYLPESKKEIEISYNNMGAYYDVSHSDRTFEIERARIQIAGSYDNGQPRYDEHQILIKKNIITACGTVYVIIIGNTSGTVAIQGNAFDTDLSGVRDFSAAKHVSGTAITLSTKAACLVGGENPGEGNIIRSHINAVYNDNPPGGSCKVSRNRMFCLSDTPYIFGNNPRNMPVVEITSAAAAPLQGTATPLSTVELFYDDGCDGCTPETYFATVAADAAGRWAYNGPVNGAVIASATLNGQTSQFTRAVLKMDDLHIDHAGCGLDNGKISGIKTGNSQVYTWFNEIGEVVASTLDVEGLKPGRYKLVLGSGSCQTSTEYITVYDVTPVFHDQGIIRGHPSCGLSNGSISNLLVTVGGPNNLTYAWYNQDNQKVGDALVLSGVPPGSYTLTASTPAGCPKTYGPVVLSNLSGPNIDISTATRLSSPCGGTAGQISHVIVSGTGRLTYRWLDQNNTPKATGTLSGPEASLRNVGPGLYRLEIKDESGCPPLVSAAIEILESSGFSIDERLADSHDEDCHYDNGSITGIVVQGASSFVWLDEDGKPAGTTGATGNLTGVKAGKYHLVATNSNSCTRESSVFEVNGPVRITYPLSAKVVSVSCRNDIGSVELVNSGPDEPVAYRWVNENGDQVGTGPKLEAEAGVYTLYITDVNQCEHVYGDFPIQDQIQLLSKPLVNDIKVCGAGPVAIQVSNAQQGTYYLYDKAGREMGQSTNGLFNLSLNESGLYTIHLQDGNCESPPATFSVSMEQGGLSNIVNSFSPNGDGKNDLWVIPGLAGSPDAIVSIFNREGTVIFKSVGYNQPFDGRYRGADLPIGVYYYVIDLKRTCGVLTGSLTLIR